MKENPMIGAGTLSDTMVKDDLRSQMNLKYQIIIRIGKNRSYPYTLSTDEVFFKNFLSNSVAD